MYSFLLVQKISVFRTGSSEKSKVLYKDKSVLPENLSVHFIGEVYFALSRGVCALFGFSSQPFFSAVNMRRMVRLRKRQSIHTVS